MQYPFLVSLSMLILVFSLFVASFVFFTLIKKWTRADYLTAIKALGIYWFFAIIIHYFLFGLSDVISAKSFLFLIAELLLVVAFLYISFHLIVRKFFSLKVKQCVILFVVVTLTSSFLGFFQTPVLEIAVQQHESFVFEKEALQQDVQERISRGEAGLLERDVFVSLPLRVIELVDRGTLNWLTSYATRILQNFMLYGSFI